MHSGFAYDRLMYEKDTTQQVHGEDRSQRRPCRERDGEAASIGEARRKNQVAKVEVGIYQPPFPEDEDTLIRMAWYLWISKQCRVYSIEVAISLVRRLYAEVLIDTNRGCWLWMGRSQPFGYGIIGVGRAGQLNTHRVSYSAFASNPIPSGMCVCHTCDVPRCINPGHLFLGTKKDNSQDMLKKGRHYSDTRLRTHCPRGHPYDSVNTRGARTCSICRRATGLRHYYKSKLESKTT